MRMCEPFHSPRTIGLSSVQPDEVPAESPSGRTTKLSRRRAFGVAAAVGAAPWVARLGWAQGYPSRPLRVIVPVAAGGANDTTRACLRKNFGKLGATVLRGKICQAPAAISALLAPRGRRRKATRCLLGAATS